MNVAGPKCSKCGCHYHTQINENHLQCTNCGHTWEFLTEEKKAELRAFVKKILGKPEDE